MKKEEMLIWVELEVVVDVMIVERVGGIGDGCGGRGG